MTICAPVDASVAVSHQAFEGEVRVLGQPTYGRFLFTQHDVDIKWCRFYGSVVFENVNGLMFVGNWIGPRKPGVHFITGSTWPVRTGWADYTSPNWGTNGAA